MRPSGRAPLRPILNLPGKIKEFCLLHANWKLPLGQGTGGAAGALSYVRQVGPGRLGGAAPTRATVDACPCSAIARTQARIPADIRLLVPGGRGARPAVSSPGPQGFPTPALVLQRQQRQKGSCRPGETRGGAAQAVSATRLPVRARCRRPADRRARRDPPGAGDSRGAAAAPQGRRMALENPKK